MFLGIRESIGLGRWTAPCWRTSSGTAPRGEEPVVSDFVRKDPGPSGSRSTRLAARSAAAREDLARASFRRSVRPLTEGGATRIQQNARLSCNGDPVHVSGCVSVWSEVS